MQRNQTPGSFENFPVDGSGLRADEMLAVADTIVIRDDPQKQEQVA